MDNFLTTKCCINAFTSCDGVCLGLTSICFSFLPGSVHHNTSTRRISAQLKTAKIIQIGSDQTKLMTLITTLMIRGRAIDADEEHLATVGRSDCLSVNADTVISTNAATERTLTLPSRSKYIPYKFTKSHTSLYSLVHINRSSRFQLRCSTNLERHAIPLNIRISPSLKYFILP